MKPLIKARDIFRDIIELYIPVLAFVTMFCVFVAQIFFRYVIRQPLDWAYEVTVSTYLWLVVLGACYAQRDHAHVVFTLVTDKLSMRWQALCCFLGNLLIAVAFIWSFIPSVNFISFAKMQKTAVLKVGLNIVYAPYIAFLVLIIIYMLHDMYLDFRVFTGLATDSEIERYRKENMNEVEHALEDAKEGVTRL